MDLHRLADRLEASLRVLGRQLGLARDAVEAEWPLQHQQSDQRGGIWQRTPPGDGNGTGRHRPPFHFRDSTPPPGRLADAWDFVYCVLTMWSFGTLLGFDVVGWAVALGAALVIAAWQGRTSQPSDIVLVLAWSGALLLTYGAVAASVRLLTFVAARSRRMTLGLSIVIGML